MGSYAKLVVDARFFWLPMRAFFFSLLVATGISIALADEDFVPYIDTHTHMEFRGAHRVSSAAGGVAAMVAEMDRMKIEKTILMPLPQGVGTELRPPFDFAEFLPVLRAQPDRVRLLAGPGILGPILHGTPDNEIDDDTRRSFKEKAGQIARLSFVSGFGEFAIVHLSIPMMGDNHPYEAVAADHPLLLDLADIAAANDLPIDIHMDLVPQDMSLPSHLLNSKAWDPNPSRLRANLPGLERLLQHNRGAKIVWAHVGAEPLMTRTVEICRELLGRHPNLYMSFRLQASGPAARRFPAAALTPSGELKKQWLELIREYPDRFMVGSDTFYTDSAESRGGNDQGRMNLHRMLAQLPPDVAVKVARTNAMKVYRWNISLPESGQDFPVKVAPVVAGANIDFRQYDTDGKGFVTLQDFVDARHRLFLENLAPRQTYLGRKGYLATLSPKLKSEQKLQMFREADIDGDGRISDAEYDTASRRYFQVMDAARTGRLLPADLLVSE